MIAIPSRDELKKLRKTLGLDDVASTFGVSRSKVDKWCKIYNLRHSECKNDLATNMPKNLTDEQSDMIYGCLLGDAGISDGLFEMKQSLEKEEFLLTIKQILGPLFSKLDYGTTKKPTRINGKISHRPSDWSGGLSDWCRLRSRKNDIFRNMRQLFYPNKSKIVPTQLILNWRMIGYWYCCDGTRNGSRAYFCTDSFSSADVYLLVSKLQSIGLECSINSRNRIMVSSKQFEFFQENIHHYVNWKCFAHKLRATEQGSI